MKKRHHGLPLDTDSLFDNAKQPSHSGEVLHNVLTLKLMSFISFLSSRIIKEKKNIQPKVFGVVKQVQNRQRICLPMEPKLHLDSYTPLILRDVFSNSVT